MANETDVDRLIDQLITIEGGYVNDPRDAGGETNFGVTVTEARRDGYTGPMRLMPRSFAADVYRRKYWVAPRFNGVAARSERVAAELFDTGVNMGPEVASTFLQRALRALNRQGRDYPDVTLDGDIGDGTLTALDAFLKVRGEAGETVLLIALNAMQGERYIELAEKKGGNEAFLYGWLANRVGNAL